MTTYKALLLNFDGTLADPFTGEINTSVKTSIRNIIEKGYIVSIATGRPYLWGTHQKN